MARVGTVSRMLLPTDGLWRGAMHAFQDPTVLGKLGPAFEGLPFLSDVRLTAAYLAWTGRLDRPGARRWRRWPSSAATCNILGRSHLPFDLGGE